jgi:hypothetical protein
MKTYFEIECIYFKLNIFWLEFSIFSTNKILRYLSLKRCFFFKKRVRKNLIIFSIKNNLKFSDEEDFL